MISIVERCVSSAPLAASTTAADVAAAISSTSATASHCNARSDPSKGWTVACSAMKRAPGAARSSSAPTLAHVRALR